LFYVGITRAKDALYLVRADQRHSFGSFEYNVPSRFLEDIPENLLLRVGFRRSHSRTRSLQSLQDRWVASPVKEKKLTQESPQYTVGMHVKHALFGEGIVINSKVEGEDEIITIAFDGVGLKKLSATLAKLEIL